MPCCGCVSLPAFWFVSPNGGVSVSESVLNNIGDYVAGSHACCSDLLWNKACGCHAWCCVDFKHVDGLVSFFSATDIVYSYDAVTAEYVVDGGG